MKTLYFALMAGIAVMGLSAAPTMAQSVLNIGLQDDPDTLDPATNWSFVGRHVLQSLCDKIVDVDANGNIIPMLATSWEWSSDSKALTFKLREGAVFHDGEPIDAAAIKYNIERDLTLEASRRKAEISAVESVEVIDPLTVTIHLNQPSVPLLAALSDRAGMIVSPKAAEALGDKFTDAPVCSGPYKFVEHIAQDRIVLEKFADYYNADQFNFDQLIYRGMPDSNVRLLNLKSGQMDLIERLAATDVASVQADSSLGVDEVTGLGYYGITINIGGEGANPDLKKSQALREAISLAIDRNAINQVVFEGRTAVGNQPFPPESLYYDKDFPVPERNVEAAKAKLAEAGLSNVTVDLLVPTDAERQQVAQLVQAMVGEVGITLNVKATELMTLLDLARQGKFQAHLVGWSGRVDPDLNITPMLGCGASGNDAHYCNQDLEKILAEARAVADPATRKAKYDAANAILQHDLPIIYLYHSKWIFAHNSNLEGFVAYPDGIMRLNGVKRVN
jgi:peptide/nickel transport system substrate-binding protein